MARVQHLLLGMKMDLTKTLSELFIELYIVYCNSINSVLFDFKKAQNLNLNYCQFMNFKIDIY